MGWPPGGSGHLELVLLPFEGSSEQQLCECAQKGLFWVGGGSSGEGWSWQFSLRIKLILPRHLPGGCGMGEEGVTHMQVTKITFFIQIRREKKKKKK